MAACLISVTGTSGLLRLDYKIGGNPYTIETSIGSFYIENTATDVTYTTLTGDLVASSLCLTVNNLSSTCYSLSWSKLRADGWRITQVSLGAVNYLLPNILFNDINIITLSTAINDLGVNDIKSIGAKSEILCINSLCTYTYSNASIVLRILGNDIPILKLINEDNTENMYIHGEVYTCSNLTIDGYEQVEPCYSIYPYPTTTTTTIPL